MKCTQSETPSEATNSVSFDFSGPLPTIQCWLSGKASWNLAKDLMARANPFRPKIDERLGQ
jgi:hypothetical protein